MKIIAIDTCSSTLGVAALERTDEQTCLLGEYSLATGRTHSELFLPMIDRLLDSLRLRLTDFDAFGVTIGPGSFTGLRIGIATAKAWTQALDKPLLAVSSTAALAHAAAGTSAVITCPIFDARRNEVYYALFREGQRLTADQALAPQELAELLAQKDEPILICGDAYTRYAGIFSAVLRERLIVAPPARRLFMASSAAELALELYDQGGFANPFTLEPVYLRLSEAEERKLRNEGKI